jgi:CheY-like chemotaxis protein
VNYQRDADPKGLRVLVVDDDPRVQAAMTAELTAVGWYPTAVGPQQLPPRHTLASQFDVALVDAAVPTVSAGQKVITDLGAAIPVVAFSINGAARGAALTAGATAYQEKDGDTDRLLQTLQSAASIGAQHAASRHRPRSSR